MTVDTVGSIDELIRGSWDDLVKPGHFYASSEGLKLMQALYPSTAHYLAGRTGMHPEIECGTPCYLFDSNSPPSPFTRLDKVILEVVHGALEWEGALPTLLPNLLCGGRAPSPSTVLADGHEDHKRRDQVTKLILAAERLGQEIGARTLSFLYVDQSDHLLCEVLCRRGWLPFRNHDYHVLDVTWKDFDGYLATLPTNRRTAIRRERRKLHDARVEFRFQALDVQDIDRLAQLEVNLKRKYGSPRTRDELARDLHTVCTLFPNDAFAVTGWQSGTLCAFGVFIRWSNELYSRQVGFDYELQRVAHLAFYNETFFYAPAEWAAANGCRQIHYGVGSSESKRLRGCRSPDMLAFTKALDEESRHVLGGVLQGQQP